MKLNAVLRAPIEKEIEEVKKVRKRDGCSTDTSLFTNQGLEVGKSLVAQAFHGLSWDRCTQNELGIWSQGWRWTAQEFFLRGWYNSHCAQCQWSKHGAARAQRVKEVDQKVNLLKTKVTYCSGTPKVNFLMDGVDLEEVDN